MSDPPSRLGLALLSFVNALLFVPFCLVAVQPGKKKRPIFDLESLWPGGGSMAALKARWTAMTKALGLCFKDPRDDRLTREESHQKGGSCHRSWLRCLDSCRVCYVWTCGYIISASATSSLGGWDWPCRNMWNQNLRRKWHNHRTCQDSTEHASPAMKYLSSQNGAHCWTRSDTPKEGLNTQDELSTSKQ